MISNVSNTFSVSANYTIFISVKTMPFIEGNINKTGDFNLLAIMSASGNLVMLIT